MVTLHVLVWQQKILPVAYSAQTKNRQLPCSAGPAPNMTSKDAMMASVVLADFDVFRRHDGTEGVNLGLKVA